MMLQAHEHDFADLVTPLTAGTDKWPVQVVERSADWTVIAIWSVYKDMTAVRDLQAEAEYKHGLRGAYPAR